MFWLHRVDKMFLRKDSIIYLWLFYFYKKTFHLWV
jgi:hypothetical protein